MRKGYVRVSTIEQNEARQIQSLTDAGVEKIYMDKQSGKDFDRPEYKRMISELREGDVVVLHSIDRLGRNYEEILEQWRIITKEIKADINVLDMPLLNTENSRDLTGTLISDIVLQLLSYVAQKERENIKKRQAEGIAIAKAEGRYKGRAKQRYNEELFETSRKRCDSGEITKVEFAKIMGVSRKTLYTMLADAS